LAKARSRRDILKPFSIGIKRQRRLLTPSEPACKRAAHRNKTNINWYQLVTNQKIYGIGIIGLGVMGREMAAELQAHPRFRVVGAYDPAPPDGSDLGRATAPTELAEHPAVDCLYVASPPAHHAAGVELAVRVVKPILCEKPLASTIAQANAMRDQVEAAGIAGAVNFAFAAKETALQQRHLVAGGALGDVKSAHLTLRFREWPRAWQSGAGAWLSSPSEGGFTREVCSHFLFQAGRMFGAGRCAESSVTRGSNGLETSLKARIDYPEVSLHIDGAIAGEADDHNRFEVIGTKGKAALVDWGGLDYQGPERLPPAPSMLDQLTAMLDGKPHPLATFAEGAAVVALTEALLA
jgi:predicted dehydrogenase